MTEGAERVLHKAGFVPKRPVPFGSKYTYAKPPPRRAMEKFNLFDNSNYGGKERYFSVIFILDTTCQRSKKNRTC